MGFRIEEYTELTQITTYENTTLGIMNWGRKNSFAQTFENLLKQSPCAYPTVQRTANFIEGNGFVGEDIEVNNKGTTLKSLVSKISLDYAKYKAFAIQCNYNIKGEITSMYPMKIAELRFNKFDEFNEASKIGYHYNYGNNSEIKKTKANTITKSKIKWFNMFNPKHVISQMNEAGGVSKYNGQILYFSKNGGSSYPIPPLQPQINFVLSDIENSILVRKETSTGFISSYILKSTLDNEDPSLISWENALREAQGARGNGKIITLAGLSEEAMKGTVLEEIGGGSGRTGIIESARSAYELNREVINGTYLIPPALAGIDQKSGFSGADLQEAYDVFNSITQTDRDTIESELGRILKNSIFKIDGIKIEPLKLSKTKEEEENV